MLMLRIAGTALADENADRAKLNRTELDKLQGRWKVVSLVQRGQDQDKVVKLGLVFTFKDDALRVLMHRRSLVRWAVEFSGCLPAAHCNRLFALIHAPVHGRRGPSVQHDTSAQRLAR
jgi:hypothetical protein